MYYTITLNQVKYEDIFGSLKEQIRITQLYQSIISAKKKLLTSRDLNMAYPGVIWDLMDSQLYLKCMEMLHIHPTLFSVYCCFVYA